MSKIDLSVVIPVYNSSSSLESLVVELQEYLLAARLNFEVILVNDCSFDSSWALIKELETKYRNCIGVNLLLRQGQHRAILAGFNNINGEFVAIMDDDGQNPPSEILKLYRAAIEGSDLVFGNYIDYKQSPFRRIASRLMKLLVRFIFKSPKNVNVSNFKIMHHTVVHLICKFAKSSPYINGEALLYSSNPKSILVNHRASFLSKSRYNLLDLLSLFKDVLFTYSLRPLRLLAFVTFCVSITGFIATLLLFIYQISHEYKVAGWTSLMLITTFLSTLVIFSITLMSEYIIRALASNSRGTVLDFVETRK